jgi:hypothetical protein
MILTGGTQVSVRGREKEGTVSGRRLVGRGLILVLGQIVSPGSNSYFSFLSAFLFLSSYFFYIFCKTLSNQFKPLSEIF